MGRPVATYSRGRTGDAEVVAGVRLSHPDRVLFPAAGATKLDLARYYETIADWVLPHVADRPLTMVRCPKGVAGAAKNGTDCFYMKHSKVWAPPSVRRVQIREKTKTGDGERIGWREVIGAARLVRSLFGVLDLASFVKTTGGRGLHVVVPIVPHADWSECLAFARAFALALVRTRPALFTERFARAGRADKILIDYLRNNRTNTSIAAFSTRARPDAPVSVPIAWAELSPSRTPDRFTLATVPSRLARLRTDPWKAYWSTKQRLPRHGIRALEGM